MDTKQIPTPYDAEIVRLSSLLKRDTLQKDLLLIYRASKEGYLRGFAAGDVAHACCEPGCPCYEAGKEAEAEEPSVLGRQN